MTTDIGAEHAPDNATPAEGGDIAMRVDALSKRYQSRRGGTTWALRDCSFQLPRGRVAALVGMNGAGKTTLLNMVSGLLTPTRGRVITPASARIAMVAQDKPLYRHFTVDDMLRFGSHLNRVWDNDRAKRWLRRYEVPLRARCGRLSGGQRTQVALAIAIGARPSVLLLDEPLSNVDPLARRDVTHDLLTEVTDTGVTVVLSSHVVAELGGLADYLLLLAKGSLLVEGEVDEMLDRHLHYVGPHSPVPPGPGEVVHARHTDHQSSFLVKLPAGEHPVVNAPWTSRPATLEDVVLAYLETSKKGGAA